MLPPLREDLNIFPAGRDASGAPSWTLHDPARNQFFRLPWEVVEILGRWHLGDPAKIAGAVRSETTLDAGEEDIKAVAKFLERHQLMLPAPGDAARALSAALAARKKGLLTTALHSYLFFRVPLLRPDRMLDRMAPLARVFFTRGFLYATLAALVLGLSLLGRDFDSFLSGFAGLASLEGMVTFFVTLLGVKLLHELGHALTAKRYGAHVPVMGVAFLLLFPLPYTDTSESWRLHDDRKRLRIAIAGIAVELAVAAWATLAWGLLPEGPLRSGAFYLATTTWITSLLINLSPFLRFDGYFVLMDFWRVHNLHSRAGDLARWFLREALFGLGDPPPERFSRAKTAKLILFAYVTWLWRFTVFLGIALLVYHFFIKAIGLLLFIVEIYWFILRPVLMELVVWWRRRRDMKLNTALLRTILVLGALAFWLFAPIAQTISLPAIFVPAQTTAIYAPAAGRLAEIYVTDGAAVRPGQVLARLSSHELEQTRRQAALSAELGARAAQIAGLNRRAGTDYRAVTEGAQTAQARLAAAEAALERLTIRATEAGVIRRNRPTMTTGDMMRDGEAMFDLDTGAGATVIAYADEAATARLSPGTEGRFRFDYAPLDELTVTLDDISENPVDTLPYPALASVAGGPVAARPKEGKGLVPEASQYAVRFSLNADAAASGAPFPGAVLLEGERRSRISALWRSVAAVLLREFG